MKTVWRPEKNKSEQSKWIEILIFSIASFWIFTLSLHHDGFISWTISIDTVTLNAVFELISESLSTYWYITNMSLRKVHFTSSIRMIYGDKYYWQVAMALSLNWSHPTDMWRSISMFTNTNNWVCCTIMKVLMWQMRFIEFLTVLSVNNILVSLTIIKFSHEKFWFFN